MNGTRIAIIAVIVATIACIAASTLTVHTHIDRNSGAQRTRLSCIGVPVYGSTEDAAFKLPSKLSPQWVPLKSRRVLGLNISHTKWASIPANMISVQQACDVLGVSEKDAVLQEAWGILWQNPHAVVSIQDGAITVLKDNGNTVRIFPRNEQK